MKYLRYLILFSHVYAADVFSVYGIDSNITKELELMLDSAERWDSYKGSVGEREVDISLVVVVLLEHDDVEFYMARYFDIHHVNLFAVPYLRQDGSLNTSQITLPDHYLNKLRLEYPKLIIFEEFVEKNIFKVYGEISYLLGLSYHEFYMSNQSEELSFSVEKEFLMEFRLWALGMSYIQSVQCYRDIYKAIFFNSFGDHEKPSSDQAYLMSLMSDSFKQML